MNGDDSRGPAGDVMLPFRFLREERSLVDIGDVDRTGIVEFSFILAMGFAIGETFEFETERDFLFHIIEGVSKNEFTKYFDK